MARIEIVTPPVARIEDALESGLVSLTEAIAKIDPGAVAHGCLGGEFGYGAEWSNDVFEMHPFDWEPECDCGAGPEISRRLDAMHPPRCLLGEIKRRERAACVAREQYGTAKHKAKWGESRMEARNGYLRVTGNYDYDAVEAVREKIAREVCAARGVTYGKYGKYLKCDCGQHAAALEWLKTHDHTPACRLNRPNFLHRASGLRVEWYKWIGRDMKVDAPEGCNITKILFECGESLAPVFLGPD